MANRYTRQELYDLVWAEPRSQLSKRLGISDVGLSKVCKKANIPMPGRGYWAQLDAGQKPPRLLLPPRGPGQLNYVTFTGAAGTSNTAQPQEEETALPRIEFESLEEVEHRVRQAVGKVKLPKTLTNPHRLIAELLQQDETRRQKQLASSYPSSWDAPLFDSRHERRRLRFMNAVLVALATMGYRVDVDAQEAREIGAQIGDQYVSFTLDWAGKNFGKERRFKSTAESKPPFTLRLELKNRWTKEPPTAWEDTDGAPLEAQLTEIVVRLIVAADKQLRDAIVWHEESDRQYKAYKEKMKKEEEAAQENARVAALLQAAASWRKAYEIRDYVAAMQKIEEPENVTVDGKPLNEWCAWARAQADKIDPTILPQSTG